MSSNPTPVRRSFLVRFFDNFLQESNIKWMLVVGMMILLASSLLLVSAHWTTCTPIWKYLIFLSYTVTIFVVGEWTGSRLGLRRTGTVLQSLTVLLVPISFLVLRWVGEDTERTDTLYHVAMLGINFVFSALASRRVFHHFLRGHQPTFLISFLLLSLAGAIVPGLPEAWAPGTALVLWAVFAVGSVKVNRHVFWLTEEHRTPRIFGFFPILLLGSQFLLLFVLHAPHQIGLDWFGLGLVLTAIPVLLTADTVAKVFQQRTGDLVRPLPWAIIGPMALGLLLPLPRADRATPARHCMQRSGRRCPAAVAARRVALATHAAVAGGLPVRPLQRQGQLRAALQREAVGLHLHSRQSPAPPTRTARRQSCFLPARRKLCGCQAAHR